MRKIAIVKRKVDTQTKSEKYLWKTVEEFCRRGWEVEIWGMHCKGNKKVFQIKNNFLYNRFGEILLFERTLRRRLTRQLYKCILSMDKTAFHTHIRAGGGCHRAWLERRKRYLSAWRRATLSMEPYHRLVLSVEKKGFTAPWVKKIIANSEMVKREILYYYEIEEERVVVVHNGVEWDEFGEAFEESLSRKTGLRQQRGLDPDRFYFLFVGSGFERKGLRFAVEALGRLPKEASLLVVGRDSKEGFYRKLVRRLGLEGRVLFFGLQQDVVPFYQVADAFVLPTIYDPFSNATLEALAMGLFCVTTVANGCSEVMTDYTGIVVEDPGDVEALANAMAEAMNHRVNRRRIRESVADLTLDRHVSRLVEICLEGEG